MSNSKRENLDLVIQDLENMNEDFYYGNKDVTSALEILNYGAPETKQDYMDAVIRMDKSIRVIDTAVPMEVYSPIQKLGVNTDGYVTVYYQPIGQGMGKVEVMDIYSRWAILNNNL